MYLRHFALNEQPFNISPDTDFYYDDPSHQDVMNMIMVALRDGSGFIKVVGEVGTGKTLLCRKLINEMGSGFQIAYLPNPPMSPDELYVAVVRELGIEMADSASSYIMLQLITDKLLSLAKEGIKLVVVLDEAQAMPNESMEALRLLTNLETEKSLLLQVVLFGQPELDQHLAQKSMRQLRQRIIFSGGLSSFDKKTFCSYVEYRVMVAGYSGDKLFSRAALNILYKSSRGIPRLINIIAHKSLLIAYGKGRFKVKRSHVRLAAADTEGVTNSSIFTKKTIFNPLRSVVYIYHHCARYT